MHNKTDNNTISASLLTAQITRTIPTPQRECCMNKSKTRNTQANIFYKMDDDHNENINVLINFI
jgi:hypothetical protein